MGDAPSLRTKDSFSASWGAGPLLFEKYEGLRNDFLIIDARGWPAPGPPPPALARALCDRHAGVGGDGVLTLLPPRVDRALAYMHITNADGSVAEMCGNGLRCVSRFLCDVGEVAPGTAHRIDTDGGVLGAVVTEAGVRVELAGPDFASACDGAPLIGAPVEVLGERFVGTALSLGNPHLVLRAPADPELARRLGPVLERDARFPQGVNVGFASVGDGIDLVVWERGAGLTEACGTGACAAAAALVRAGELAPDTPIEVRLPGGALTIEVAAAGDAIFMTGPARAVFSGTLRRSIGRP